MGWLVVTWLPGGSISTRDRAILETDHVVAETPLRRSTSHTLSPDITRHFSGEP